MREAELDPAHLVQALLLCGRQIEVEAAEIVVELRARAGANQRDDHALSLSHPSERDLRRRTAELLGQLNDLRGDSKIALLHVAAQPRRARTPSDSRCTSRSGRRRRYESWSMSTWLPASTT